MILVSEAIIYKNAVVIKLLYTSVAKVTMFGILGTKVFTVHTYIIKMIAFSLNLLQNFLKVWLLIHISWIHKSKYVENNGRKEEKIAYDISSL